MSESQNVTYTIEHNWPINKGVTRKRKGDQWVEAEEMENTLITEGERSQGRVNALTVIKRGLGFNASTPELDVLSEALNLRKGSLKSPIIPSENS